jgi:chorismate mutase/prephenate dehydrogenase
MASDEIHLSSQRERLDQIDQKLLDLLSERNTIIREVSKKKIDHQLPVFVPKRENQKVQSFRKSAESQGISADWAEDFLRMVMASSRDSQSTEKYPRSTEEPKNILIVGSEGRMGRLYKRIMEQSGHHLYGIDKHNWYQLEEIAPKLDAAIVSVPIHSTADVIRRLAPKLRKDTVLADFTSKKDAPISEMQKAHSGPVLGLHPMHGPDVQNISKQLMVVCPVQKPDQCTWFIDQAHLWGMRILKAEPKKHDHVMHLVQGLRHFVALLHGSFMKTYDLDPQDILDYSSPIYRAELMMTGRIFAQSAELYADIVFADEERRQLLLNFLDHNQKLAQLVQKDDREGFIKEFEEVTDFFGSFATQALEESGYLINRLTDRFA